MSNGMDADDVRIAIAALDLPVRKVAQHFAVQPRTVWRWQVKGAPPHIALAFDEVLAGRIRLRGVRYFLRRVGRSRNDGDRYSKDPSQTDPKGSTEI